MSNNRTIICRLGGRLDLLVSQIKANTEDDILASENLLVYEDNGKQEKEAIVAT